MSDIKHLSNLAKSAIQDPIVLEKLCERILKLIQEDIRTERDRTGYSRSID